MLFSDNAIGMATIVTFGLFILLVILQWGDTDLSETIVAAFLVGLIVCLILWPFSGPTVHGTVTEFPTMETVVVEVYGFPIFAELGEMEPSVGDTAYVREEEDGWEVVKVVKERN